jgi:hypothetical protein
MTYNDGKIIHQYKKNPQHMMLKIVVLAMDRHTNVVRLNQLVGSSLLIIESPKTIQNMELKAHTVNLPIQSPLLSSHLY